jgi:hypothetical protein
MAEPSERPDVGSPGFEELARRAGERSGPISEFRYLLSRSRKYWMLPIILALLAVGALLIVGGTAGAPLLYALF